MGTQAGTCRHHQVVQGAGNLKLHVFDFLQVKHRAMLVMHMMSLRHMTRTSGMLA